MFNNSRYYFLFSGFLALIACDSGSGSSLVIKGSGTTTEANPSTFVGREFAEVELLGGASELKIQVSAFYISKKADCTDAIEVQSYDTPETVNFLAATPPTLFEGNPAEGAYKCLIIVMQDVFTFKADATAIEASDGACEADTDYQMDIYRTNSDDLWKDKEGEEIVATGDAEEAGADQITIFASTDREAVINGPIGAHLNQVSLLTAELQVPGQTTFNVDTSDRVGIDDGRCTLEGAVMSFSE